MPYPVETGDRLVMYVTPGGGCTSGHVVKADVPKLPGEWSTPITTLTDDCPQCCRLATVQFLTDLDVGGYWRECSACGWTANGWK